MPLSEPKNRKHLHDRTIQCRGYLREDGLWDIEATLRDTKSYAVPNHDRGEIAPGEAIHGMAVRLTMDDDLTIVAAEVAMDDTPFKICSNIAGDFAALAGIQIKKGWRKAVHQRFGGVKGCTHIVELLGVMATVAFQTIYSYRNGEWVEEPGAKPPHLNSCHALSSSSEVVARMYPDWHTTDESA